MPIADDRCPSCGDVEIRWLELVGDPTPQDLARARSRVDSCPRCRAQGEAAVAVQEAWSVSAAAEGQSVSSERFLALAADAARTTGRRDHGSGQRRRGILSGRPARLRWVVAVAAIVAIVFGGLSVWPSTPGATSNRQASDRTTAEAPSDPLAPSVRLAAVLSTARHGSMDDDATFALVDAATRDPSPMIRIAALQALAENSDEMVDDVLTSVARDRSTPTAQFAAIELLLDRDPAGAGEQLRLIATDRSVPSDVRLQAAALLADIP